jgi:hypothetical protein
MALHVPVLPRSPQDQKFRIKSEMRLFILIAMSVLRFGLELEERKVQQISSRAIHLQSTWPLFSPLLPQGFLAPAREK